MSLVEISCPDCGDKRLLSDTSGLSPRRCQPCAEKIKPSYRGHRNPKTCPVCKKEYIPHRISQKHCSHKCGGEDMRESRRGEGNPNYRKGLRVGKQIRGWSVAEKGETACRVCGSQVMLNLHHAIPRSKWKLGRTDLRNGITLCHSCHSSWHQTTRYSGESRLIRRFHFTPEEWDFMESAEMTGIVTSAWLEDHYPW